MKEAIKIPSMGESVVEATIGRFLKSSGSFVKEGEEIVELETEKVNQALYAPASGTLEWLVKEGDTVSIGDTIGNVDKDQLQKEIPSKVESSQPIETPKKEEKPQEEKKKEPSKPPEDKQPIRYFTQDWVEELKHPKESQEKPQQETPTKAKVSQGRQERREKMSRIRKVIASRLVSALKETAMLTTFNEVDMSSIIELRTRYQEMFQTQHGVKLGFMSFFVKAVLEGLKAFPSFNAYIDKDDIVYREYFDIGIAVGTDRGLVVPVLRQCDHQSFADIEKNIAAYAVKARKGGLSLDDLQGGGFTITNGGVYGSLLSTPILNPPQVGILGMHKIEKRAVVIDDAIVIRPMMYLALSYDHRLIDGKEAVSFLVKVKEVLEDPAKLLFLEGEHGNI